MPLQTIALLLTVIIIFASPMQSVAKQDKQNGREFEEFNQPEAEPQDNQNAKPLDDFARPMSLDKLTSIIQSHGSNVEVQQNGNIIFTFDNAQLVAVVAESANRMRLLSPIIAATDLTDAQMAASLVSNYHLALDARYAVGDGVLYSVFIHSLKELTAEQVVSAIRQVATLRNTFGTSYSSGEMNFGVQTQERVDI